MSLASVLYPSPTKEGMREWTFANFNHHEAIEAAILEKLGVQIQKYRLWPSASVDRGGTLDQDWLSQHQQAHDAYNQLLGIPGQDLTGFDPKNRAVREAFFFLHYQQHISASSRLGITFA